jgi:hypothetical protein
MAFGEPEDHGSEETEMSFEDWYEPPTESTPLEIEPEPDD